MKEGEKKEMGEGRRLEKGKEGRKDTLEGMLVDVGRRG